MERVLLRRCDLFLADIDPEACGPRPSPMACLAEFLRLRRIFRHTGQTKDLDWATTSALHRQYRSRGGSGEADPTPVRDEGSDGSALRLRGDTRTVRALPRVVGAAEEEAQRPIRLSALSLDSSEGRGRLSAPPHLLRKSDKGERLRPPSFQVCLRVSSDLDQDFSRLKQFIKDRG